MPGKHATRAEKARKLRRRALEAILTHEGASPAEILAANMALARLDRQEPAKAPKPKPKPEPPAEPVSDEILAIIKDPDPVITTLARPGGDLSPVAAAATPVHAETPPGPVLPLPWETPSDIQASTAVSMATIWGTEAVLTRDFKKSEYLWIEQERREQEARRRQAAIDEQERQKW